MKVAIGLLIISAIVISNVDGSSRSFEDDEFEFPLFLLGIDTTEVPSSSDDDWAQLTADYSKFFHGDKRKLQKVRSVRYEILKQKLQLLTSFQSFDYLIESSIQIFASKRFSDNVGIIESMQDLVFEQSHSDFFINAGGIDKVIIPGLKSTNEVKMAIVELIHLAAYENEFVKKEFLDGCVLEALLKEIDINMEYTIVEEWAPGQAILTAEVIAAIQSITENYEDAEHDMFRLGGLRTFKKLFNVTISNEDDLSVPFKIVLMMKKIATRDAAYDGSTLVQKLIKDKWCEPLFAFVIEIGDDILNAANRSKYLPKWANIERTIYNLMVTISLDVVHSISYKCSSTAAKYESYLKKMLDYFENIYKNDDTLLSTLHANCINFLGDILSGE